MARETDAEIAEITIQLKEHLRFYREIGVTDIGGGAAKATGEPHEEAATPAIEVDYSAPDSIHPQRKATMPDESSRGLEFNLFGEPITPAPGPKSGRHVAATQTPCDLSLEVIREDIGDCTRCKLSEHRTNIVFGEGNPHARLVFVGEAPGADEDATGRPFVGRAGQLLDKIIASIGLRREDVYIANVVKCRPPQNRTPEKDETSTCEPFLFRQLRFINPSVIVTLGLPAFQTLCRTRESMSRARGQWRDWNGVKVMPTFHPAYLLRDPTKKREVWEDIRKVRDYLAKEKLL